MHHTLIPQTERKALRREYHLRVIIVACFTLSVAGLLGLAALVPSFASAILAEQSASAKDSSLKSKDSSTSALTEIKNNISMSQKMLAAVHGMTQPFKMSDIISGLIDLKGNLRLTAISVSEGSGKTLTLNISGLAPTRDDLAAFKTRFENALPGSRVELPVSDLARSTLVNFALKITEQLQ